MLWVTRRSCFVGWVWQFVSSLIYDTRYERLRQRCEISMVSPANLAWFEHVEYVFSVPYYRQKFSFFTISQDKLCQIISTTSSYSLGMAMSRRSHVKSAERKIKDLRAHFERIGDATASLDELIQIIHKPGWTTILEATLLEAILDSQTKHAQTVLELTKRLVSAAKKVELNPQPLPPG